VAQPILPFALPLVVCDEYLRTDGGKLDVYGTFHTIRPESYPHVHEFFCVLAHLTGGLGTVTTFVDVRHADTLELIFWTHPRQFQIPNREVVVRLVNGMESVPFPKPGLYLIELYCENTCIAGFRLRLAEPKRDSSEESP
jgi:hypothetical protein